MKPKRVFVSYDDIRLSVIDSQVLTPLRKLQALGFPHDFVGFRTVGALLTRSADRKIGAIQSELEGKVTIFTTLPWIGRFDASFPAFCLGRALKNGGMAQNGEVIIHARGHHAGFAAILLKRRCPHLRVIANLRGVVAQEFALYGRPSIPWHRIDWRVIAGTIERRLRRWERAIADEADVIICVSNAFRSYLQEQYSVSDDRVAVVTTAVDTELFRFDPLIREKTRRSLGLESKLVFTFCGSMYGWELPDAVLASLRGAFVQHADAHLLILTTQLSETERKVAQSGLPPEAVTVLSVPHRQVPEFLMAADVGLLIREGNIVNRVAAPTKFGEYLACGLPALVSEGVGDTAAVVSQYDVGWLLASIKDAGRSLAQILVEDRHKITSEEYRRHCSEVGNKLYSWESQMRALLGVYERVEGKEGAETETCEPGAAEPTAVSRRIR